MNILRTKSMSQNDDIVESDKIIRSSKMNGSYTSKPSRKFLPSKISSTPRQLSNDDLSALESSRPSSSPRSLGSNDDHKIIMEELREHELEPILYIVDEHSKAVGAQCVMKDSLDSVVLVLFDDESKHSLGAFPHSSTCFVKEEVKSTHLHHSIREMKSKSMSFAYHEQEHLVIVEGKSEYSYKLTSSHKHLFSVCCPVVSHCELVHLCYDDLMNKVKCMLIECSRIQQCRMNEFISQFNDLHKWVCGMTKEKDRVNSELSDSITCLESFYDEYRSCPPCTDEGKCKMELTRYNLDARYKMSEEYNCVISRIAGCNEHLEHLCNKVKSITCDLYNFQHICESWEKP
jgi:hypothetical protein